MHSALCRSPNLVCFRHVALPRCARPRSLRAHRLRRRVAPLRAKKREATPTVTVLEETAFTGLTALLDTIKWSKADSLVPVIVQNVDTGELLMQAYADRAAIAETMQTKLATFYSRSRQQRWCKGETSGNYIHVNSIYIDCDRDSVVYLGDPVGPSCHTGARTCWFHEVMIESDEMKAQEQQSPDSTHYVPQTTLYALEDTIEQRRQESEADKIFDEGRGSWTAKLLRDPDLLCKKIVEEAQELCDSLTREEGQQRTAEEMADVLYHCMVLLNKQEVKMEDVMRVLRGRFGTSGIQEKASRTQN